MKKSTLSKLIIYLAVTISVVYGVTVFGSQIGNDSKIIQPVYLKSREFIPEKGVSKQIIDSFKENNLEDIHAIVKFTDNPTEEEKNSFREKGINLLAYLPEKAWFASVSSEAVEVIMEMPKIWSLIPILPEDRLSQSMREFLSNLVIDEKESIKSYVMFFEDVSRGDVRSLIPEAELESEISNIWSASLTAAEIKNLSANDLVQWIDLYHPPLVRHNDGSRALVKNDLAYDAGIKGEGTIIAEWDGGWIDKNHRDFKDRIVIGDVGCSEPDCKTDDHATHVGGTAAGDGAGSAGKYRGMAPKAKIISYEWPGTIQELNLETQNALNVHNASVSQNSWGWNISSTRGNCNLLGDYDLWSAEYDKIVRGSLGREMPIVFSAGNHGSGSYGCAPGYGTISGPGGTAKNTISVGALNTDNSQIADFSSRGPTDDGRVKPDLVAGGCEVGGDGGIKSTISGNNYGVMCGTSMSAPAVSGNIALIVQEYKRLFGKDPSPALIKGILMHSAKESFYDGPDYATGYGLLDVQMAINYVRFAKTNGLIKESIIRDKETHRYNLSDLTGYKTPFPTHVTLIWDDYQGTVNASSALVNDIDMKLITANNVSYDPFILDRQNPQFGYKRGIDSSNNFEQIGFFGLGKLPNSTLEIFGKNLPQGSQKYFVLLFDPEFPWAQECSSQPTDACVIKKDITFEPGTYYFFQGFETAVSNVNIDCDGAVINGLIGSSGILFSRGFGTNHSGITIKNCIFRDSWINLTIESGTSTVVHNELDSGSIYIASSNNLIHSNVVKNANVGISFGNSSSNTIRDNIVKNSRSYGIFGEGSVNNSIYNNFIFNNSYTVRDAARGNNFWNTQKILGTNIVGGSYIGGNYYDDYTGIDTNGDGIGDTNIPYTADGGLIKGDYLPLTFSTPGILREDLPRVGKSLNLYLRDKDRPNTDYLLILGASGISPGYDLRDGRKIQLNLDSLTETSLFSPNAIGLTNSQDRLDRFGKATSTWNIPELPFLKGFKLHAVLLTIDRTQTQLERMIKSISPPIELELLP